MLLGNDESLKLTAKDVMFAFHTAMNNHSFNSMTRTISVVRQLFHKIKFICAKTKTRDLIKSILAPCVMKKYY